jgi:hypothetical protein
MTREHSQLSQATEDYRKRFDSQEKRIAYLEGELKKVRGGGAG